MDLPPIKKAGPPDYPERHINLAKTPTGEIRIEDLKHEARARARRRPKEIAAAAALIIGALVSGAVAIIKALGHDHRTGLVEYRLDSYEKRLDKHDERLERCCEVER